MKRIKWLQWALLIGMVVIVAVSCSKQESQSIDPPQIDYEANVEETISQAVLQSQLENQSMMNVTLYLEDQAGYIAPLTRKVPSVEHIARQTLEYMVDQGPLEQSLPYGFSAIIPAGTTVIGMNIIEAEKLAIVDFSSEFKNYDKKDERKLVEAITWALTEFPTIDQVQLRVEGESLREMPVAGLPLDEPLSRSLGINLEYTSVGSLGHTMPVTLYFQSQTNLHESYFVPVTRLINRTEDRAAAVIEQLIRGPLPSSALFPVIVSDVEVTGIEQIDEVLSVYLTHNLLDDDHRAPSESLQAVILSLTENMDATHVQILMEDGHDVFNMEQINHSHPIMRPVHINQLEG